MKTHSQVHQKTRGKALKSCGEEGNSLKKNVSVNGYAYVTKEIVTEALMETLIRYWCNEKNTMNHA